MSVITSWATPQYFPGDEWLRGMSMLLRQGVQVLDLYFLDHGDLPWYLDVLAQDRERAHPERLERLAGLHSPEEFAAELTGQELDVIADRLRRGLWEAVAKGRTPARIAGRRPRFGCLATFFPNACHPHPNIRATAVKALRAAVYLAGKLGCRCVEAVGGPGFDRFDPQSGAEQREAREKALAQTIWDVYRVTPGIDGLDGALQEHWKSATAREKLPSLTMELEPGESFLLNSLDAFVQLRQRLYWNTRAVQDQAARRCLLNLDIAHALLLGISADDLDEERLFGDLSVPLKYLVGHVHISDHAGDLDHGGSHGSDMPPGRFHLYATDYEPYLTRVLELANRSPREAHADGDDDGTRTNFSGLVAVEMEASNDLTEVMGAYHTTCAWLNWAARESYLPPAAAPRHSPSAPDHAWHEGALAVFDLGNSTNAFFTQGFKLDDKWHPLPSPQDGASWLERYVTDLCEHVHQRGGSMMSYTGDGLVAFFERAHYVTAYETTQAALRAVCDAQVAGAAHELWDMTLRAALHWGTVYIPITGVLKDQSLGLDVIAAARLCQDIAGSEKVKGKKRLYDWPPGSRWEVAATDQFVQAIFEDRPPGPHASSYYFEKLAETRVFKGLPERYTVHLLQNDLKLQALTSAE